MKEPQIARKEKMEDLLFSCRRVDFQEKIVRYANRMVASDFVPVGVAN
ncbi:hypothetical protein [Duganella rhizosphaerae]